MDKKVIKLDERVLGMSQVAGLDRLVQLAGIKSSRKLDEVVVEDDEVVDAPAPAEDDALALDADAAPEEVSPEASDELASDLDVAPEAPEGDDVGLDSPEVGGEFDLGTEGGDMDLPAEPVDALPAPGFDAGLGGMGAAPVTPDARSDIETAVSSIVAQAPNLKISDYKQVLNKLEDLVAQVRAMGGQFLREAATNPAMRKMTIKEAAKRSGGFKKAFFEVNAPKIANPKKKVR